MWLDAYTEARIAFGDRPECRIVAEDIGPRIRLTATEEMPDGRIIAVRWIIPRDASRRVCTTFARRARHHFALRLLGLAAERFARSYNDRLEVAAQRARRSLRALSAVAEHDDYKVI